MGADALAHVLQPLTGAFGANIPNLLVGLDMADDAAVYQINEEQAIVATTDFFPPVVDDPYTFGAIAAANALSDVYAMGGKPLFCMNLVAFPDDLDPAILTDILRGGADKVRESGAVIAGGHTITDPEPKYGLAAIGLVHPHQVWIKGGAQPDDVLLLTKSLGTGVITTALKNEAASEEDVAAAVASMMMLNAAAANALRDSGIAVHACTDITGFGLLGHALEMATQSHTRFVFKADAISWLPGAMAYAEAGYTPGGTRRNAGHLAGHVNFAESITEVQQRLFYDPQTSGGLLVAVSNDAFDAAKQTLDAANVRYALVGEVVAHEQGSELVVEA